MNTTRSGHEVWFHRCDGDGIPDHAICQCGESYDRPAWDQEGRTVAIWGHGHAFVDRNGAGVLVGQSRHISPDGS